MVHLTTSYHSTLLLFFNTMKGSLSLIPVPLLPRLEQTFGSSLQASSLYSSHINTVSFSNSQTLKLFSVFLKRNNKFPLTHLYFIHILVKYLLIHSTKFALVSCPLYLVSQQMERRVTKATSSFPTLMIPNEATYTYSKLIFSKYQHTRTHKILQHFLLH